MCNMYVGNSVTSGNMRAFNVVHPLYTVCIWKDAPLLMGYL